MSRVIGWCLTLQMHLWHITLALTTIFQPPRLFPEKILSRINGRKETSFRCGALYFIPSLNKHLLRNSSISVVE